MLVRMPEKTKEKIKIIENTTNVKTFLSELMDLFLNYAYREGLKPVQYDSNTGKVLKEEWVEVEKFKWVLYLHKGFREEINVPENIRMFLIQKLEEGSTLLFTYDGVTYSIVEFKTNYDNRYVRAGIKIQKVETI